MLPMKRRNTRALLNNTKEQSSRARNVSENMKGLPHLLEQPNEQGQSGGHSG